MRPQALSLRCGGLVRMQNTQEPTVQRQIEWKSKIRQLLPRLKKVRVRRFGQEADKRAQGRKSQAGLGWKRGSGWKVGGKQNKEERDFNCKNFVKQTSSLISCNYWHQILHSLLATSPPSLRHLPIPQAHSHDWHKMLDQSVFSFLHPYNSTENGALISIAEGRGAQKDFSSHPTYSFWAF